MPTRILAGLVGVAIAAASQGATFIVTSTADAGAGSLRQAIMDANGAAMAAFLSNTFDSP